MNAKLLAALALLSSLCACVTGSGKGGIRLGPGGVVVDKPTIRFSLTGKGHVSATLTEFSSIASQTGGFTIEAAANEVEIALKDALARTPTTADIVLAVDSTGSMGTSIDGVKKALAAEVMALSSAQPTRRFGVVTYRDRGDTKTYVVKMVTLLGSPLEQVLSGLDSLKASGGGDFPEHVHAAIDMSLKESPWRPDVPKFVIVVGDAPGHDYPDDPRNAKASVANAQKLGVKLVSVAITCSLLCKKEIGI